MNIKALALAAAIISFPASMEAEASHGNPVPYEAQRRGTDVCIDVSFGAPSEWAIKKNYAAGLYYIASISGHTGEPEQLEQSVLLSYTTKFYETVKNECPSVLKGEEKDEQTNLPSA